MARIGWVEFAAAHGRVRELYVAEADGRHDVAGIVKSFSQRERRWTACSSSARCTSAQAAHSAAPSAR